MAQEEIQKPTASVPVVKEETPAPVKEVEVPVTTEKAVAAPAPEATEEKVVSEVAVPETEVTAVKEEEVATGKEILQSESFKEEGYLASELQEAEKNALAELKELVREALNKREFTAPPPPPAPVKEEKVEEKKTEETEEKKEEVKTEEKSLEAETKEEEKSAAPATVETKKEEVLAAPAPIVAETKKEETPVAPAPVETKPAAPVVAETKKEEILPAAPVTTETKVEEKVVPVETTPAAPVTTETKEEEKAAPVSTETKEEEKAAPVETKKEEKATASTQVKRASKFIKDIFVSVTTSEKKKEEEKPAVVTIEKAFAADQEEETKTVEAVEESIVSITLPETAAYVEPEEVSIWGIPLLEDERSDVILLKFLRARDFKVKEAFTMLKNTVQWRKENKIDDLVSEDLEGSEFEKLVFTHGVDKQGHVVIYSSYGEFQNKEIFSDKEKLSKFLKWRIQFQEKCVRSLDFSPEAKSSFVFVSDFRNAPGLGQRALWQFIKRAVKQFEDNYPEFVAKELFINVPWWYIPYYKTFGSIITSPRTRSKMVLSGPSKSAETIFKYVAPEVVPVKYGGLSKDSPFTVEDGVTEAVVKSTSKYTIDLPATEGSTLSWELRVLGADVSYGAQFEPSNEASYTVIVSKNRKVGLTDEPVITDSFKASEAGKVVITIDNQTFKKKKVLYRSKTQA
ncbi:Patellin-2 [Arabidopsis thaliana]|uniref:PATL2 n=2 Tax=Arabidopsis TaxID=3701 RepID=A0A178WBS6_ARATH|nr:CRAL/TRIO N-terminal domain superfamily [Arabidopsis thaliana x Arabidopsis arenosa]OAP15251.1 PATL2 [Arabidopsis thaliana]